MPEQAEKVKEGVGVEVLQRLIQLVTVQRNCIEGARRCEGRPETGFCVGYAGWVTDLAKTNAQIEELLPRAFEFLVNLKRELQK